MSTSFRAPDPNMQPTADQVYRRPRLVTVLATHRFFAALITLVFSGGVFYLAGSDADTYSILLTALGVVYLVLGVMSLVAGVGLWRLKRYGRTLGVMFAGFELIVIPIGTIVSSFFLRYFDEPGARILFSERPARALEPEDLSELNELSQVSAMATSLLFVTLPLVVILFNGIVSIAIPSLLRARVSANEAAVIADMKHTLDAAQAYAATNGGHFDAPECLMAPADCIPGYPQDASVFLAEDVFGLKRGYQREFHPGPPAEQRDTGSASLSASSIQWFAFLAYPSRQGITGFRGFCLDSKGNTCLALDGSMPTVSPDGECIGNCPYLE